MKAEEKMRSIHELITQIMSVKNRYYVTNICILVVEHTYDAKKHLYPLDIRVLPTYDHCIEILNKMLKKGKEQYDKAEAFISDYISELHICESDII